MEAIRKREYSRSVFPEIRNHLAGQAVGATRDEALIFMVTQVLFCQQAVHREIVTPFLGGTSSDLKNWHQKTWKTIRALMPANTFVQQEFRVEAESLEYLSKILREIDFQSSSHDFIADLFETFFGSAVRGQEGQFFTPKNAVELLVTMIDPKPGEKIIDPACGAGGFLASAADHLVRNGEKPTDVAQQIFGIDKDCELVSLSSMRLALQLLASSPIECADSLSLLRQDGGKMNDADLRGAFDVVLTNPPFGSKIVAVSPETQKGFELGYKWKWSEAEGNFVKCDLNSGNVSPQIYFVERCLDLLRPGGRLGIVVPESLISSATYRYVMSWLMAQGTISAVVGMPESLFKTSGKGGTHAKTALLVFKKSNSGVGAKDIASSSKVFMAEAKFCGNDSRGRKSGRDDLPQIEKNWRRKSRSLKADPLGFEIGQSEITNFVLAPRYYDPIPRQMLKDLIDTHDFLLMSDLIEDGSVNVSTGHEVGAAEYGTGNIPFVRTSDISSWEIKIDPKHGVSEEIYQALSAKQDVQENDIFLVRDGTYLVGQTALVTQFDKRIVYQSHLYKIRLTKHPVLNPHLLLAILSSVPVQRQIQSKRFTQDIIDSLGNRISELVLPVPKSKKLRDEISAMVMKSIEERSMARELARNSKLLVAPVAVALVDDFHSLNL